MGGPGPLRDPYTPPAFGPPVLEDTEAVPYYDLFQVYIESVYMEDDMYLIRYLPIKHQSGIWYLYSEGVYKTISQPIVDKLYFDAMAIYNKKTSTTQLNFCVTKLKTWVVMVWEEWDDHNPDWENCLDGMIHLPTRKLHPHSPKFMFKKQTPRHFFPDCVLIPALFEKATHAITSALHRENYLKFFLAVVHKKYEWGKFLILFGKTGSGKSTLLQIHPEMYGRENTSKTDLWDLGRRFGLDHMHDKRVNTVLDMPVVEINPYVIGKVKTLTGEDGDISVEIKGGTKFMYPIQCFLEFGIQEVVDFTEEARREIDSWFKRVVMGECTKIFPEDSDFKKAIRDPDFLDELYSWAINTSPMRFYDPGEEEAWIERNKTEWLTKCDPVLRILKERYVYTPTTEDIDPDGIKIKNEHKLLVNDVYEYVLGTLENEGQLPPKQLKNNITKTLLTMRIRRDDRRSEGGSYKNIVRRAAP